MYCLDTNIIVDIFYGDAKLKEKLEKLNIVNEIYITPITLCELYKGAYLFFNVEEGINEIEEFVSSFQLLEFNQDSCKEYGKIFADLKRKGKIVEDSDIMIASVTKINGLVLVTRNKKHFENTGVKIEGW